MSKKDVPDFDAPQPKKGSSWNDTRGASRADKRKKKEAPNDASQPIAIDNLLFKFSGADVDHEYVGDWDWNLSPKETHDVLDLLSNCAVKTWGQIKSELTHSKRGSRALNHVQPVDTLSEAAQKRLGEIGRGDQESVFRLRHGNMVRIWGVIDVGVFRILWFDRDHKVYPIDT